MTMKTKTSILLVLLISVSIGLLAQQQVIGSFPVMNGSFENEPVGALTVLGGASSTQLTVREVVVGLVIVTNAGELGAISSAPKPS